MQNGASPDPIDDPLIGTTLGGKYRIEARIGSGANASIYRATHLDLDRPQAIKLFAGDRASIDRMQRFEREARAIARLTHPNIVAIHDFGRSDDGSAYLVLEYLEGNTLGQEIDRVGALEIDFAVDIFRPVCLAVHAAHHAGIIHRDLKPENIFLERPAAGGIAPRVLDFGIAKLLAAEQAGADDEEPGRDDTLTRPGIAIGTPYYMAPEQIIGDDPDPTTDVYALGCVLFHMLTGRPPFVDKNKRDLFRNQLVSPPPAPSEFRPGIPRHVERAVLRALSKDRTERFRTALDFASELGFPRRRTSDQVEAVFDARLASIGALLDRAAPTGETLREDLERGAAVDGAVSAEAGVLLARLGVFRGSWTPRAAEEICAGDGIEAATIGDLIEELASAGCVTSIAGGRVAVAARARSMATGSDRHVAEEHAAWYRDLVRTGEPHLWDEGQRYWFDVFDAEIDNIRRAIDWYRGVVGDRIGVAEMATGLGRYWEARGAVREGLAALAYAGGVDDLDAELAGRVAFWNGALSAADGASADGRGWLHAALAIWQTLGDASWQGLTLWCLAECCAREGDEVSARRFAFEALSLATRAGDRRGMCLAAKSLGDQAARGGKHAKAKRWYARSLGASLANGYTRGAGVALYDLGSALSGVGDLARAEEHFVESLEVARDISDRDLAAANLLALGAIANTPSRGDDAWARLEEALAHFAGGGDDAGIAQTLEELAMVAARAGARQHAAWIAGMIEGYARARGIAFPEQRRAALGDALRLLADASDRTVFADTVHRRHQVSLSQAIARDNGSRSEAPSGTSERAAKS